MAFCFPAFAKYCLTLLTHDLESFLWITFIDIQTIVSEMDTAGSSFSSCFTVPQWSKTVSPSYPRINHDKVSIILQPGTRVLISRSLTRPCFGSMSIVQNKIAISLHSESRVVSFPTRITRPQYSSFIVQNKISIFLQVQSVPVVAALQFLTHVKGFTML